MGSVCLLCSGWSRHKGHGGIPLNLPFLPPLLINPRNSSSGSAPFIIWANVRAIDLAGATEDLRVYINTWVKWKNIY